jgi:hypothetical protein
MRRVHLFEWEDQPWLPLVFRDFITDQLKFTHTEPMRAPVNRAVAERLRDVLVRTGAPGIVDLCAGAGGPVSQIARILADDLGTPVPVTVTDLFPNVDAFRRLEQGATGRIRAHYAPVDATNVPPELAGLRTMFTALHHFQPGGVRAVLADAVRKNAPIAVFEPLERTIRMMVLVGAMSFLRGFTHAHRVGRMTPERFLFTYLLPVAPAVFAWDGSISTLRTYTAAELRGLADEVTRDRYLWDAGRFDVPGPFGPMPTTYLIGVPASESA